MGNLRTNGKLEKLEGISQCLDEFNKAFLLLEWLQENKLLNTQESITDLAMDYAVKYHDQKLTVLQLLKNESVT